MEEPNPVAESADLLAERDQLLQEKAELENRLLRRQADFENFRRRVERERAELAEYVGMESVGALLPIVDDFLRALRVECADKEYARGMELIHQRMFDTLIKLGLEPIEAVGRPFDPNLHHAVDMVQTADAAEPTVLEEYQRGYNFRGRLLRPSMVRVAVPKKNEDQ